MNPVSGTTAPEKPRLAITPNRDSWLAGKLAEHHAAKLALAEAETREKDLRHEIENALALEHRGILRFDIAGGPDWPAKTMTHVEGRTQVNGKRLKAERPDIWEQYAETSEGHWELRPAGSL